jgi:hypothetical protein
MDALLKLKHWQLFLLTCATKFVYLYIRLSFLVHLPMIPFNDSGLRVFQLTDFASGAIQLAWLYIVSMKLNDRTDPQHRRSTSSFKYCFAVIAIVNVATSVPQLNLDFDPLFSLTAGLALLGCYFYCELFAARVLVKVEGGDQPIVATVLSMMFFPIGLWWIQPRINKVFSPELENPSPDMPLDHNLGQQPQS